MDRLSNLSQELLREIASYLPKWTRRLNFMTEHVRYYGDLEFRRDTTDLKSFALCNRKCKDAANSILYEDFQVVVYSNEHARNLIASPHLHSRIRNLAWVKERNSEPFDEVEESTLLIQLLKKADRVVRLTIHHPEEFRVIVPPELSQELVFPRLETIWTARSVWPQALLSHCPSLEALHCQRQFTKEDAVAIVSNLPPNIKTLTLSIADRLTVAFLKKLATVTSLEELDIDTPAPHLDPWADDDGDGGWVAVYLGAHLVKILRPLQNLKALSLGIAVGSQGNLEEPTEDFEEEHAAASLPLAKFLPNLESIGYRSPNLSAFTPILVCATHSENYCDEVTATQEAGWIPNVELGKKGCLRSIPSPFTLTSSHLRYRTYAGAIIPPQQYAPSPCAEMARFSDLPAEILREIASHLPRVDTYRQEYTDPRYSIAFTRKRDLSTLRSFASLNKTCRDVGDAILYGGDFEVIVTSREHADHLSKYSQLHSNIRQLVWNGDGDKEEFDEYKEGRSLSLLLKRTLKIVQLRVDHTERFDFLVPSDLYDVLYDTWARAQLKTLWTGPTVSPIFLLRHCRALEVLHCERRFTKDEALDIVKRLRGTIKILRLEVEVLTPELLHKLAKTVPHLEELEIATPEPHWDPWFNGFTSPGDERVAKALAKILRPFQRLKVLSLGIHVGLWGNLEEPSDDFEECHAESSMTLAKALPNLEKISWMEVAHDTTNACGLTNEEEEEEEEEEIFDTGPVAGTVVRDAAGEPIEIQFEN
ncbi:hypothetical protein NM688_g825 [Phlebia brevispora]|uniref:Uncharacterized protein n=1 Tax=Phlebia brevispora TaxID=194682 RepID=A0ACC1TD22_9APHY|nr:hypothetical protein NM688_g825 [Phlebia brevispora]